MLQLSSKLQRDQIHKAALASGLGNDAMMSLLGQQKQLSITSNGSDNTNYDLSLQLESLINSDKMQRSKPKRIRTRPGKTPAVQINWTKEEVSKVDSTLISQFECSIHDLALLLLLASTVFCCFVISMIGSFLFVSIMLVLATCITNL